MMHRQIFLLILMMFLSIYGFSQESETSFDFTESARKRFNIEITGNVVAYAHFPEVATFAPASDYLIVKVNSVIKGEVQSEYIIASASASRKRKKYRAKDVKEFKLVRAPICDRTKEELSYFLFSPADENYRGKSYLIPSNGADVGLVPSDRLPCYLAFQLPQDGKKKGG